MDCGYDAPFSSEVDPRFQCPICLLILKSPVQTACGHRFCSVCIKQVIPYKNTVLTCPVDKTYTKVSQMFPDLAIQREILSLRVECTSASEGCTWEGELRDLENHRALCLLEKIPCPHGCNTPIRRIDAEEHMEDCSHRLMPCQYCNDNVLLHLMEAHGEVCPKMPVTCPLCMEEVLPREELAKHQHYQEGQCSKVVIYCPYNNIGCSFKAERQLMPEHTKHPDFMKHHLDLALEWIGQQNSRVHDLAKMVSEIGETYRSMAPVLLENDKKHRHAINELRERNVTGKLHWRLKMGERRQRSLCYSSPIFYTGCPGYKVQLTLDMEGPREGNSRYTTLSLALLCGDYDNQIIFPFNATCFVTLQDQIKCPPQQKAHATTQLVIREVPKNPTASVIHVDPIYKREITCFMKRADLVGPGSRYLRNNCLHFEVTVIHSHYPPEGPYHMQSCICSPLLPHGLEMTITPKRLFIPQSDASTQAESAPVMEVVALNIGN